MARLTRPNPVSPVSTPLAPAIVQASATRRGSPDPGRVTTPFLYLGELPADPTDLPDDGVARWWKISGAVKCFLDGTTYTIVPPSASGHAAVTLGDAAVQAILDLSGQAVTLDAQAANLIFAGPAAGGAADPAFRAMVLADLVGHGKSKHTQHANWKLLYSDGSGDEQEVALGAVGTLLRSAGAAAPPTMALHYSVHQYVFCPDAGPGEDVETGVIQGPVHVSGPSTEMVKRITVIAETAAQTAFTFTLDYDSGNDDFDTFAVDTEIDEVAVGSAKGIVVSAGFTTATITARSLIALDVTTVTGTAPKDVTIILEVWRPLQT